MGSIEKNISDSFLWLQIETLEDGLGRFFSRRDAETAEKIKIYIICKLASDIPLIYTLYLLYLHLEKTISTKDIINVSNLKTGMYLMRIESGEKRIFQKLVKI